MDTTKTVVIDGHTFKLAKMGCEAQFEAEAILIKLIGPAAAIGVGTLIEGLAEELAEFMREAAGEGESFNLENILDHLDTADDIVRRGFDSVLERLPSLGREVLIATIPALASRLSHVDNVRLMQLAVFGRAVLIKDGKALRVVDFAGLDLISRRPMFKWQLLGEALAATYSDDIDAFRAAARKRAAEDTEKAEGEE